MIKKSPKIIEENGLVYYLAEDGCYYPDMGEENRITYPIGKYGIIRAEYMWEHCRKEYFRMMLEGTWNVYLHKVDEECRREVELAVKRIMKTEGVTEQMKKEKPLEWVRKVEEIRRRVEEVVNSLLQR